MSDVLPFGFRRQASWETAVVSPGRKGLTMARRYSRNASKDVERSMRKRKRGTLKSGRSGRKVKSRKQAIAIGLSEARKKGKKVPPKRGSKSKSRRKKERRKRYVTCIPGAGQTCGVGQNRASQALRQPRA